MQSCKWQQVSGCGVVYLNCGEKTKDEINSRCFSMQRTPLPWILGVTDKLRTEIVCNWSFRRCWSSQGTQKRGNQCCRYLHGEYVCVLASFPGPINLQFLITCSMQ